MKNALKMQAFIGLLMIVLCFGSVPAIAQQKTTAAQKTAPAQKKNPTVQKSSAKSSSTASTMSATTRIKNWPKDAKMAAEATIKKYGQPSESTPSMLVWYNNGPWKKTIVFKEEMKHDFPMAHKDVLQQCIQHDVPIDMYDELAAYDGSVVVERTNGTLSARCDKEEANFLALNLAHDIINGKRTVEDARMMYAKTITGLMNGEKSDYTSGLMFKPEMRSGDSDKPASKDMMMNGKGMEDKKN